MSGDGIELSCASHDIPVVLRVGVIVPLIFASVSRNIRERIVVVVGEWGPLRLAPLLRRDPRGDLPPCLSMGSP